jgi:hypothetical protein
MHSLDVKTAQFDKTDGVSILIGFDRFAQVQ